MSVIQSRMDEIRYLKRKNLENESRIVGNMLRDQIRQYGVDCIYYKMNTSDFKDFKGVIDRNIVLKKAYGYEIVPDYTISTHMITYAEVQSDIFQINKYGILPNTEVDFNFDRIQFACDLATKCGQLKEYPIENRRIVCEVPSIESSIVEYNCQQYAVSDNDFPFELGTGYTQYYVCDMLSGQFKADIHPYEYDKEYTILCNPYEHTDFFAQFPVNEDLYRSLEYKIANDDYLETLIYLTYKISKIKVEDGYKSILSGYVHGSILFYDIDELGKYVDLIQPMVGDIIEIDFPDDKNKEKYEITEFYDKSLASDGISPLLHKYIWKCKARRYTNSYEDNTPQSDADDRIVEMQKHDEIVREKVAKSTSLYQDVDAERGIKQDAVYGGYDNNEKHYDKTEFAEYKQDEYDFIDDGQAIDIIDFTTGSKIITNGYDLIFCTKDQKYFQIATHVQDITSQHCFFEQHIKWLKASDFQIVFTNILGESTTLAFNEDDGVDIDNSILLDDINAKSMNEGIEQKTHSSIYSFSGTRTFLFSDGLHLFAHLASSNSTYQII